MSSLSPLGGRLSPNTEVLQLGCSTASPREIVFIIIIIYVFIYLWLCWVFIATCGLSLTVASGGLFFCREEATLCGTGASHYSGFSHCRAQTLGTQTSVVAARGL